MANPRLSQVSRLPQELRERKQWAISTLLPHPVTGKPDKAPRHPQTGRLLDLTNPEMFSTFDECINSPHANAIGFILTADDPYCIVDLDRPANLTPQDAKAQENAYNHLDSYSEFSQSGQGVHIIVRAKIGGGRRRGPIEVYDQERYMICTGNVFRDSPIVERQALIEQLVLEMMPSASNLGDLPTSEPETLGDDEIIAKAAAAANGDKWKRLFEEGPRPGDDHSQLDASLAQLIAFYTLNHDQALRLFQRSKLWRPNSKGKNPEHYTQYYLLERTFGRAFRAELRRRNEKKADLEVGRLAQLKAMVTREIAELQTQVAPPIGSEASFAPPLGQSASNTLSFPPGIVGMVADFIYKAAPRPVREIALAGALTFVSGIVGRQFNISGTGLNLYIVMLAETGRGKEAAASGIDALMAALRPNMPIIDAYRGPGHIASGQALIRTLDEHPSQFSLLSEFGHTLQAITHPRANAADVRLRQALLDLFSKSGKHQLLQSSAYADKEKNTKSVLAPCFAFLGDTTPEAYYAAFGSSIVAEGLLPRFITISYDGPRVERNPFANGEPDAELIGWMQNLVSAVAQMYHNGTFMDARVDPGALSLLDAFDRECDARINDRAQDAFVEVWNRAHLKALRLAALIAVGCNWHDPIVSPDHARWAIDLIRAEITNIVRKTEEGETGQGEVKQLPTVIKVARAYYETPKAKRVKTYNVAEQMADYIPYHYLRKRLRMHKEFTGDRRGLESSIKAAIQTAVDLGQLQQLTPDQVAAIPGSRKDTKLYVLGAEFGNGVY
jgi:hypothetical protein